MSLIFTMPSLLALLLLAGIVVFDIFLCVCIFRLVKKDD